MTREEAIEILKAISVYECYPKSAGEETKEAINMAIEALQILEAVERIKTEVLPQTDLLRCKDCRHRCKEPIYSKADPHWVIYQIGDCPIICKTVGDDDFCSYGERREL